LREPGHGGSRLKANRQHGPWLAKGPSMYTDRAQFPGRVPAPSPSPPGWDCPVPYAVLEAAALRAARAHLASRAHMLAQDQQHHAARGAMMPHAAAWPAAVPGPQVGHAWSNSRYQPWDWRAGAAPTLTAESLGARAATVSRPESASDKEDSSHGSDSNESEVDSTESEESEDDGEEQAQMALVIDPEFAARMEATQRRRDDRERERAEAARVQRQLSDAESSYQRNDVGQTVPPHISSNGASAPDAAVAQTNAPQRDATQQAMAAGAPDYGAHAARIAELETKLQADFVRIVESTGAKYWPAMPLNTKAKG